jgi:16S rRNA C967 or C1407 C5-methylase (RsmB/RsmF family)
MDNRPSHRKISRARFHAWRSILIEVGVALICIHSPELINTMRRTAFCVDDHVPDLLLFHPDLQLQEDTLYADGKLILQDKASCMPAVVLDPPVSLQTTVIDATAGQPFSFLFDVSPQWDIQRPVTRRRI